MTKTRTKGKKRGSYQRHKANPLADIKTVLDLKIDMKDLDQRTQIAIMARKTKKALQQFVGNNNAATEILIQQIVYKYLRLSIYTANNLENPEYWEAPHYLSMANSLRIDLQELTRQAGQTKPPSLDQYIEKIQKVSP